MKVPSFGRTRSVSFNVTSLIDIVFLLVIFFLVASHVARTEAVEPVDLPEASQFRDEADQSPNRVVITILEDGSKLVGGRKIEDAELEQLILSGSQESDRPFRVVIRPDESAKFQEMELILMACARFGVGNVEVAVTPEGD